MRFSKYLIGLICLSASAASMAVPIAGQVINGSQSGSAYSMLRDCDDPSTCQTGTGFGDFLAGQALNFDLEFAGGEPDFLEAENQIFATTAGSFELIYLDLEMSAGNIIGGTMEYSFNGESPSVFLFNSAQQSGVFNTYTYIGGVFTAYVSGGDCNETCGTGNDVFSRGINFAFSSSAGQVPVPEPMSILLLGVSLLGFGITLKRK